MDQESIIALLESGELRYALPAYADGSPILSGDVVLAFHGEEEGRVSIVVATLAEALAYGAECTGVSVDIGDDCYYFGMEYLLQQPIQLVSRASEA